MSDKNVKEENLQRYELTVLPNMKPGGKYKVPVPGTSEKVTIAIPMDATPGQTISFALSRNWIDTRNKLKAAAAFAAAGKKAAPAPAPTADPDQLLAEDVERENKMLMAVRNAATEKAAAEKTAAPAAADKAAADKAAAEKAAADKAAQEAKATAKAEKRAAKEARAAAKAEKRAAKEEKTAPTSSSVPYLADAAAFDAAIAAASHRLLAIDFTATCARRGFATRALLFLLLHVLTQRLCACACVPRARAPRRVRALPSNRPPVCRDGGRVPTSHLCEGRCRRGRGCGRAVQHHGDAHIPIL